jgi:hypothetical protein
VVEEVVLVPPAEEEFSPITSAVQAAGGSSDDDDRGNDNEGARHISFMETPSGKCLYKCPIFLEEYESSNKVLVHIFDFIANNSRAPDVVEQHCQDARDGGIPGLKLLAGVNYIYSVSSF